ELAALHAAREQAVAGTRRLVFVTGEGGIGKTTLVEHFLGDVERDPAVWVARGHCLEPYGGGEAYMPLLQAVGRLAPHHPTGDVARVLRRHAPMWVTHLAALDQEGNGGLHDGGAIATTPARMLREMADALEVLTRTRPVVLVLEDLHWSDPSTIDLITYVAR